MSLKPGNLPAATYCLSLAQTINLTMAVLSVTVGALVGLQLAPSASLATVPYGLQFLAVMLFTYAAAMLMRRKGRAWVFYLASLFLALAGVFGVMALYWQQFVWLCASHFLLGMYIACANFYRFAATDNLPAALKPKAIAWVVLGGVLAALLGPVLAVALKPAGLGLPQFAFCYGVMVVFAILNVVVVRVWQALARQPAPDAQALGVATQQPPEEVATAALDARNPLWPLWAAMLSAGVGYWVMNVLMIQSSLLMTETCTFAQSSQAIQWHVLAMFLPSFVTGKLVQRCGHWRVINAGVLMLALSALWGVVFQGYAHVVWELVVLGVAWNLTYVGGSAMLAAHLPKGAAHRWQGLNDTLVAMCATLGAFSPSVLYSWMGWVSTHQAALVLCAVLGLFNAVAYWHWHKQQNFLGQLA